jgi:tetratricopeptide (TPR) repeat protein
LRVRGATQLTFSRLNDSDPAAAKAAVVDTMGIANAILDRDPGDLEARRLLGSAHLTFALREGRRDARIDHLTRASDIFEALVNENPSDGVRQRNAGLAQKYLGDLHLSEGSYQVALTHHRRALEIDQERLAASPGDRRRQFDVAIDLSNVGFCQWGLRQFGDSTASYERSRETFAALADTDPKDVAAAYWRARVHTRLARVYHDVGTQSKALEHSMAAVRRFEPLKDMDAVYKARYGEALVALGRSHNAAGRRAESCAPLAGAMRIFDELAASNRSHLVRSDEAADGRTLLAGCRAGGATR